MALPAWAVPGNKCVCIDDSWDIVCPTIHRAPMLHEVLTIRETEDYIADGGLIFDEIPKNNGCPHIHYWSVLAFRPLTTKTQEEDMAIFRPMLTPAREDA